MPNVLHFERLEEFVEFGERLIDEVGEADEARRKCVGGRPPLHEALPQFSVTQSERRPILNTF